MLRALLRRSQRQRKRAIVLARKGEISSTRQEHLDHLAAEAKRKGLSAARIQALRSGSPAGGAGLALEGQGRQGRGGDGRERHGRARRAAGGTARRQCRNADGQLTEHAR